MNRLKAFLASAAVALGAILAAVFMGRQAKAAKAEAASLRSSINEVANRAEKLQWALNETAKAGEKANGERKDLASAPDCELVNRANSLFR